MTRKQNADVNGVNATLPPAYAGTATFFMKWAPAFILAIVAALYYKALFNDFVTFDDYQFIIKNEVIKDSSFDAILKIFTTYNTGKYQPFTTLSYVLEYRLFGFNPFAFHLTNIIFHLLSTFVLFKIAERLSGSRITAIVVAFLFGIHPMHVEAVAWISERKDMLYAFFYLSAILAYLRYCESGYRIKYYIVVFLLFLLSLFSKTEAITLPLVLIVIDTYRARKITFGTILEKVPMLLFSFLIGILGFFSQQGRGFVIEHPITIYGSINRFFLATTVPAFYIVKVFAPFSLSAEHYYPDMYNGMLPWMYYASLPLMLFMIWLVCRRGPLRKELLFGMSFFIIIIMFMPQVIFTGPAITPERYSYLSYIGIFYIIGQWITSLRVTKWKPLLVASSSGFSILCCVLTWQRIDTWKNSITLYTDVIEKNYDIKDLSYFYWLRGKVFLANGELLSAIEDYNYVISLQPTAVPVYKSRGAANFNAGRLKAAIVDFDSVIRLAPDDYMTYANRASAKASSGDLKGALTDYNSFLGFSPTDNIAYTARGSVRLGLKDSLGACSDWRKAVALGDKRAVELARQYCH